MGYLRRESKLPCAGFVICCVQPFLLKLIDMFGCSCIHDNKFKGLLLLISETNLVFGISGGSRSCSAREASTRASTSVSFMWGVDYHFPTINPQQRHIVVLLFVEQQQILPDGKC